MTTEVVQPDPSLMDPDTVNRWLWAAILLSVLLQVAVVHVPFLNTAFTTAPLSPSQWVVCLALSSAVLWVAELRKAVLRRAVAAATTR